MERVFISLAVLSSLAFADADLLFAQEITSEIPSVVEATLVVNQSLDPIVTGTTNSIQPKGILPHLDGCDAVCQAKRLGLVFED